MAGRGRYSPTNLISSENLPFIRGVCVQLPAKLENSDELLRWRQQVQDSSVPKILDLFCGAGGMSAGFVSAGFTVAAALDNEKYACETYAANIPARVICTDISKIEKPASILEGLDCSSIDVIVGGPPCQGFSNVGRARILSLDEEKQSVLMARNELYQQYFRFVEHFQPSFFVMENVQTLVSFGRGEYFIGIQEECRRLGYSLEKMVLNVADYGVPQNRRRLFIVGCRIGRLVGCPRPAHKDQPVNLRDAIDDLPVVCGPALEECLPYDPGKTRSEYQALMRSYVLPQDREKIYDHLVRPVRDDDRVIFSLMQPGDRYTDIPEEYRRYNSKSFKDKYYKLKPDAPCVTITAHMAKDGYRYIHWDSNQCRTLSVREAARIQSFGDHYRFAGFRSSRFRQIGNAVPPFIAEAMAKQVLRALQMSKGYSLQLGLPLLGYEHSNKLVGTPNE